MFSLQVLLLVTSEAAFTTVHRWPSIHHSHAAFVTVHRWPSIHHSHEALFQVAE